jgi:nucleotide-binding universal stress UspA family protein
MLRVRSILFATDYSPCATRAYTYATALAERFGATLHVLHVRRPGMPELDVEGAPLYAAPPDDASQQVRTSLQAVNPAKAILEYARANRVDIIVMGARGQSGLRLPGLGGIAREVVRHAPCPVLTTRQPLPMHGVRRLLAPTDFSESSREAVGFAKRIVALAGADLDVLHVLDAAHTASAYGLLPAGALPASTRREWEGRVTAFAEDAGGPEVTVTPLVESGPAAPTIINLALQRRADLVLLSTVGRTGLRRAFLGSVTESVVESSPCATLTVTDEALAALTGRAAKAQSDEAPPADLEADEEARKRVPRRNPLRHSA